MCMIFYISAWYLIYDIVFQMWESIYTDWFVNISYIYMILLFVMILEEKFNEEDILHLYLCMHSCSNWIFQWFLKKIYCKN